MRAQVKVEEQVENYVKALAPEPRRGLTRAIKRLADNQGNIKQLEGKLEGFSRLRVAGHRVIFYERSERGKRVVDCVFAEKRAIVYELFIRLVSESAGS